MAIVQRVMRTVRGKAYEYYAVRFTDPGTGKGKTRYFSSRKLAEQARVELEGRVVGGCAPQLLDATVIQSISHNLESWCEPWHD